MDFDPAQAEPEAIVFLVVDAEPPGDTVDSVVRSSAIGESREAIGRSLSAWLESESAKGRTYTLAEARPYGDQSHSDTYLRISLILKV